MKMMTMNDFVSNVKIAVTVAMTTITTGLGSLLDIIPDNIGKLGTLAGAILSVLLIYTHLQKRKLEMASRKLVDEKLRIEISILKEKEFERIERARLREEEGLPVRRNEDNPLP